MKNPMRSFLMLFGIKDRRVFSKNGHVLRFRLTCNPVVLRTRELIN